MKASQFFNSTYKTIEAVGILAVWILLFLIPVFADTETGSISRDEIQLKWLQLGALFFLFLLNVYLLIPLLLHRKKYLNYFLILFVVLPLITCIELKTSDILQHHQALAMPSMYRDAPLVFSNEMPPPQGFKSPDEPLTQQKKAHFWSHLLLAFLVTASAAAYKMLLYWIQEEKKRNQLESLLQVENEALPDFILVKADYKTIKIQHDDILFVESANEYVKIFLSGGEMIMTFMRLKNLETELPKTKFMRVQRSFIVNLNKIKAVEKNKIYIEHKKTIPIGEQYKESFQEFLGKHFVK